MSCKDCLRYGHPLICLRMFKKWVDLEDMSDEEIYKRCHNLKEDEKNMKKEEEKTRATRYIKTTFCASCGKEIPIIKYPKWCCICGDKEYCSDCLVHLFDSYDPILCKEHYKVIESLHEEYKQIEHKLMEKREELWAKIREMKKEDGKLQSG